ncbi:SDR family oxidoreductase [Salidesulfovibrio brasiliensis]|uniref:SDR family oxidoreductase n=1 Tax=Salidesulfovibrio brasiliensis TaxID=221711 RepID=UPI0006D11F81|nr:SDR family oxidoreductase [Salidesulfovibrio brasiliensis]
MLDAPGSKPVLILGATGYVGGRLAPLLLERGYKVRAAGRSAAKIHARSWGNHENLEVVTADLFDEQSLVKAMDGCDTAFYLVHSMSPSTRDFAEADREAAYNAVEAANEVGLDRFIYLGGLGEKSADGPELSHHLRSRAEVGRILKLGCTRTTILRAAMILGSGSASFEIMRYLCDRLPVMITPRWVNTRCQPISIRNVLGYLAGCLEHPKTTGRTLDIGGPDIVTYAELFQIYAEEAGLKKQRLISLPVMTPKLSSYWINLVTPVPFNLAQPLAEGLANEVICRNNDIRDIIPQELVSCREAIKLAIARTRQMQVDSHCFDTGNACTPEWSIEGDASYAGGTVFKDRYAARLQGDIDDIWKVIERIGGEQGWYFGDPLWRFRGFIDKLIGGPGVRRGRTDPDAIHVGDALDFWRVVDVRDRERLLLKAEMRLPGEALLEFRLTPLWEKAVEMKMTASFMPRGLFGLLYWYAVYPFHSLIFRNMIENIAGMASVHMYERPKKLKK